MSERLAKNQSKGNDASHVGTTKALPSTASSTLERIEIAKTGNESFSTSTRRTRAIRKAQRQNKKNGRRR